jgi:hypothetical protein
MKLYANSTEPSISWEEDIRWTDLDISFYEHEA